MEAGKKTFANVDVGLSLGPRGAATPHGDRTLAIAVLGDFSGGDRTGGIADRRAHRVDVDSLDAVMARVHPRVRIETSGRPPLELTFASLDDFSPDALVRRVEHLAALRRLRQRLQDPSTFDEAAALVRAWSSGAAATTEPRRPDVTPAGGRDIVAELLAAPVRKDPPDEIGVDALVRDVVSRHVRPGPDASTTTLTAQVDAALGSEVRSILRDAAFRRLETTWLAADLLTKRAEVGERVTLDLLDANKSELAAELAAATDLAAAGVAKRLSRGGGARGDEPFDLVVGLFRLEATAADAALLARLAAITKALGACFIADGDPALAGCKSIAARPDSDDWDGRLPEDVTTAWAACQMLPAARHAALVVPRLLARAPHGARTTPADTFDFEEIEGVPRHDDLAWGSAAAACAAVVARRFAETGGPVDPAACREIDDLPLFVHDDAGERVQVPCAEAWLTERSASALAAAGLVPLLSVRGASAARIGAWHAIAGPSARLAGAPWV